ncbi:hypothetical protein BDF21DRAFT_381557 [Thamnidium elegans]|uniref:PH domain-containing protein n=1 Tax=Thamnidium elegans TaxID=101142 RepID=A0A8H7SNI8_9FUNG|nr:hypothetical protein INT48_001918 [Thamnidium elegans]KAI8082141.1 hypothetical protein BDF21DRAFT_381557 [Thamnidium elegans]
MSGRRYLDNDNMEVDSDNASVSTTGRKPKTKPTRRKVSMATRRRSRLLYLEKYGLNQPDWHTSSHDDDYRDHDDSNNNNREPIEYTEEPEEMVTMATTELKRPVSIRNYVQTNTSQKRPSRFVKPQKSNSDTMLFPPSEFKKVDDLITSYTEKVYMEGYLQKRNDLNSNGTQCETKKWSPWYVELCGPVLTLWDNSATNLKEVYPQYINITDSTVKIENCLTVETRTNLFSLNSAGANRFILQASDVDNLAKWIIAIRLSCFECSHLQEIYTRAFITRPQFNSILNNQQLLKMEGFVQVRFPGSTGWKKFWSVVSNTRIEKKLFSKKLIQTNGQVLFFESKKSKHPVMTLKNVVQAYTVYPESPKLINMATIFKLEGSLYKNQQLISDSSSALLMTSNTNDLVQWLFATFNAFKLYGKPSNLLDDINNQLSLNFAENLDSSRLFLEPQEVNWVDAKSSLLANKKEFSNILLDKLLHGPRIIPIEEDRRSSTSKSLVSNPPTQPTQPTHLRTVTCASDVSDDDDEEEEDQSNSDSDESLFKLPMEKKRSTVSSFMKPITPNASKSSSEVSSSSSSSKPSIKPNQKKPFYSAQKSNITPHWPMYGSTGTIVTGEYLNNHNNNHWETSSVDPRMMSDNNSNYFSHRDSVQQPQYASSVANDDMMTDEDDDDIPIASVDKFYTQNSLLEQAHHDRISTKTLEKNLRATGQPLVQTPTKKATPRTGLLGVISEKERENKTQNMHHNRAMMDEQLLMRERIMMEQRQQQIMMQQYMQQQYANGMVPMMMPMVDPRMMPMMDPRLMAQPVMMMDPRLMASPTPQQMSTSTSNYSNRSRYQQHQYAQSDNQSVGSNSRLKSKRHMSSSPSITNSINSASGSRYAPSARRTKNN